MPHPDFTRPWAKLTHNGDGQVLAALPLIEHCLDVAAACSALLAQGGWARALEHTAGRPLTAQDVERLVVLAALHDLGKANAGFFRRHLPGTPPIGHEGEVAALWFDPALRGTAAAQALREAIIAWGAQAYLPAIMAHHGRPREAFARPFGSEKPWEAGARQWRAIPGYDPLAAAATLIGEIRARYPLAWEAGDKLPGDQRFISLFAGLLVLADWLGSDTRRFPVEGPHGAERAAMRGTAAQATVLMRGLGRLDTPAAAFPTAFGFEPRGVQTEAAAGDLGPVALIEAETGSGKTEAALWRWLELRRRGEVDGLYFALPTRSAAVQLHRRVQRLLDGVWGENVVEGVLAVPGYLQAGEAQGQALPGWEVRWDDDRGESRWAAERANRFLAARVAVGTIDQALLGALRVKHAPVRAAALVRSLLVIDEVHASDAYMGTLLERLLANHVAAGGHALLLSATLGAAARAQLLGGDLPPLAEAQAQPYPALTGTGATLRPVRAQDALQKRVTVETAPILDDAEAIAVRAIMAARGGAAVLVVRNSVAGAVAVAQAVEALAPELAFRVNGTATLHHGRFAASDRQLLDRAVEAAFGRERTATGRVLVGTQTLEQSLDLDADLLLTDLAPIDVLLQRIGRLHRHPRGDRGAFAEARVVVLRPAMRDLSHLLGRVRERHGLGPMKDGAGVYPDLVQLEATLRLLEGNPAVSIPADNRRLVEGALHPDVREAIIADQTGWINHAATLSGVQQAERGAARAHALDLAQSFRDLVFPDDEAIGTRLGVRDLLIDLPAPFIGPFGGQIARLTIPHWMAGGVGDAEPVLLQRDGEGQRIGLGERVFLYGRWGLMPAD